MSGIVASLMGKLPLGVPEPGLRTPAEMLRDASPQAELTKNSPAELLARHRPSALLKKNGW